MEFYNFISIHKIVNSMHELLSQIESLLRHYDCVYEANCVEIARQELDRNPGHFWSLLSSDEWWGESWSICQVDLAILSGFTAEGREDSRSLRGLLIEIHDALLAQGIDNPRASLIAAEFRKWTASRI